MRKNLLPSIYLYLAFGIFYCVAIWQLPKLSVPHSVHPAAQRTAIEDRSRQTLIQALGGLFFLFTAYTAWGSLKVNQENARTTQANLKVAQDNLRLLEENAQRTRDLEIYKVAFPKKFEVASILMKMAQETSEEVHKYYALDLPHTYPNEFDDRLREKIESLSIAVKSNRWLFGEEFISYALELDGLCNNHRVSVGVHKRLRQEKDYQEIVEEYDKYISETTKILDKMTELMRQELHIVVPTISAK